MQKTLDKFFTGAVLLCLVSSAYLSYYMRPWRWLRVRPGSSKIPDNPFAKIPFPQSTDDRNPEKAEKVVV